MLIGGDFNNRAKQLLALLAERSDHKPNVKVDVAGLVEKLQLDRTELKNLLEYLEGRQLVEIASIGGPFLYGHVEITEKGILKAAKLK
jgi:DNA-binding MarR family transcriptional regulator